MQNLINAVNQLYKTKIKEAKKITTGYLTNNYIVFDNQTSYFLKQYRYDSLQRVRDIHKIIHFFSQNKIPVIIPLSINNHKDIFTYSDKFYALFPFVDSQPKTKGHLNNGEIVSLGKTLASIHLIGRDNIPKLGHIANRFLNSKKTLEEINFFVHKINTKNIKSDFDILSLNYLARKKLLITQNRIENNQSDIPNDNHLLHGDFHIQNVFFNDTGQVSHVFDLDKTNYGPRTFELFHSMIISLSNPSTGEINFGQIKFFIDAYRDKYYISNDEIKKGFKFYYLYSIHNLWLFKEHYTKNNHRIDDLLLKDYKGISFISKNFSKLISFLISS